MTNIPRSEHPNPQFFRDRWQNLNGVWQFEFDRSASGEERSVYKKEKLDSDIIVPFCPESRLSGIGDTDFIPAVWYKKVIKVNSLDMRVVLHIGACDYETVLYINEKKVGTHKGGYTSFAFDITDYLKVGDNSIVIQAKDDTRSGRIPSGKQSDRYSSYGCFYTRTTGIWQTVYLEYVPAEHIKSFKLYPDVENTSVRVHADVIGNKPLSVKVLYEGRLVGEGSALSCAGNADMSISLSEKHLWELGFGRLYDVELTYGEDTVKSYFGLRSVTIDGYKFLLNGKCVFQRTVLDQGFYPDGIYTAPTDEALVRDIEISMAAGFNGARLHEKVFEPRFLYHCDRLGYMVWGEYANWGYDHTDASLLHIYQKEWLEALNRDFNHPSIIGWCPFNETWDVNGRAQSNELIESIYRLTKQLDTTRPCIDTSGNYHTATDIFDFHDYDQNPDTFRKNYSLLETEDIVMDQIARAPEKAHRQRYVKGQAVFCSEYGGIKWDIEKDISSWGYGNAPKTEQEFLERYEALTETLLGNSKLMGLCYTQLYDVEQEKNGLYTYDRRPKFDMSVIKEINTRKAKIEN